VFSQDRRRRFALEAFPALRLTGKVTRVGTLARSSVDRPFDEKRFDLIVELTRATPDLRPEMTARADIVLGDRPGVLLVPVNAVFERQGVLVCHVLGASDSRPARFNSASRATWTSKWSPGFVKASACPSRRSGARRPAGTSPPPQGAQKGGSK